MLAGHGVCKGCMAVLPVLDYSDSVELLASTVKGIWMDVFTISAQCGLKQISSYVKDP